ncbi:hypothetical protein Q4574_15975 [Aliiglaciecola sp. 3_MG-2023]|uniref:hypothetical protein n=1 Tax=Aliiglaciecola sp. 3_MG-2023 TaxID=3062644 RepID=UPI0026E40D48|nr:hypothetical protein [Aliiglaciecola sp. 3_MG-2023]MDO6694796.1 hypothetical protein [Aliiglaciecola sp. 3_MG-2023]
MNGRVYDYNLSRFMSVDPFIQMPESSQSINPYSYQGHIHLSYFRGCIKKVSRLYLDDLSFKDEFSKLPPDVNPTP